MINYRIPFKVPLNSKLPVAAGFVMVCAIIISLVSFMIAAWDNLFYVHTFESFMSYVFSILTGALVAVFSFSVLKSNVKLLVIPMFITLVLTIIGVTPTLLNIDLYFFTSVYNIHDYILPLFVAIALPIVFLLTASASISTKIPLVILCVINLYIGAPLGLGDPVKLQYVSILLLEHQHVVLSFLMRILSATPYLLIALALSRDPFKENYEKTAFNHQPVYVEQPIYAEHPSNVDFSHCISCGSVVLPDDVFCESCGITVKQTPYQNQSQTPPEVLPQTPSPHCESCGSDVFPDNDFCVNCGNPVKQMPYQNQPQTPPPVLHQTPPQAPTQTLLSTPPQAPPKIILKRSSLASSAQAPSDKGRKPKKIFCIECGNMLPAHAKFCDLCGFRTNTTV